jgi:predicted ABC-type ATPase
VPVDRAYEAHLARQPKPKMRHGSDALTDADHDTLRRILPKRVLSMEYNESYDRGVQHRDGDATPGMLGRFHERMTTNMAAVRGRTALTGSFEVESLAANVAQDAGFIDGAMGRKRKYRRPLWGTDGYGVISGTLGRVGAEFGKSIDDATDWFDATDVTKHLGNRHDQRTHARGGGGLSGVSIRRPGEQPDGDKPDLIEITDQFGDKIRVTKNDSLYDHLERKPDGGWGLTAEREALHDEIVAETLAGVPGGKAEPTMYMLGGGPAAGKTTMLNQGGIDVPTTGEGGSKRMAVLVNADEVKMALPEFGGSPEAGRSWKQAAGFVHEESSLLSKRIQQAAVAAKMDIVLDGTGDSKPNKLAAKIAEARRAGYKVEGHYATVPTGVAVTRSRNRGTHPVQDRYGRTVYRVVPDSIVMGTHSAVSDTFPKAQHLFDRVTVYDTTNGARRIAGREPGKRLQIDDQQAWQMFLSKGDE